MQYFWIYSWNNLLYLFILGIVISFFFQGIWKSKKFNLKFLTSYSGEQRVHKGEISRWGGIMIYSSLLIYYNFFDSVSDRYLSLLYLIAPFMILSFIEDTFNNINFVVRLNVMVFTALIICIYWLEGFPVIENFSLLSDLLKFPVFTYIFFSLALVAIMNGANFIDGMNGLASIFFLGVSVACASLAFVANDTQALMSLLPWTILLIIFLFFNFPLGKLFLGDSGAYLLALLFGTWLINFFSNHQHISSWNAVLILIYPLLEVTYSALRKILQGNSPFYPDRQHLHIKIYDMIENSTKKSLYANNITTMFLAVFWLTPTLALQFVYSSQIGIVACIISLSLVYLVLNFYTPSVYKNNEN